MRGAGKARGAGDPAFRGESGKATGDAAWAVREVRVDGEALCDVDDDGTPTEVDVTGAPVDAVVDVVGAGVERRGAGVVGTGVADARGVLLGVGDRDGGGVYGGGAGIVAPWLGNSSVVQYTPQLASQTSPAPCVVLCESRMSARCAESAMNLLNTPCTVVSAPAISRPKVSFECLTVLSCSCWLLQ